MNIGDKIREIRKSKGMTQADLASILKTSPQNLAQYENGKRNPKSETIIKIADALQVPLDELLGKPHIDMLLNIRAFEQALIERRHMSDEEALLLSYNTLNALGKEEARKRVEELTEIKKYTDPDN